MSRRGWILFLTVGPVWGIPYLLIKEAVAGLVRLAGAVPTDHGFCMVHEPERTTPIRYDQCVTGRGPSFPSIVRSTRSLKKAMRPAILLTSGAGSA